MKIDIISQDQLQVCLDAKDLKQLDITVEDMDYNNIETRRVIWTLLDQARKECDTSLDLSGRLRIEVTPEADGGCTIFFTALEAEELPPRPQRLLMKPVAKPMVFQVEDADLLFEIARRIPEKCRLPRTDLYEKEGRYRIVVSNASLCPALGMLLYEYTEPFKDPLVSAHTREHWNRLIGGNALERLR